MEIKGSFLNGTVQVNDGQWHHVMAVSEVGELTSLYVDGELVATAGVRRLTDGQRVTLLAD